MWGERKEIDACSAGTLSEDGHLAVIAVEGGDVLVDPTQGECLVPEAQISWTNVIAGA